MRVGARANRVQSVPSLASIDNPVAAVSSLGVVAGVVGGTSGAPIGNAPAPQPGARAAPSVAAEEPLFEAFRPRVTRGSLIGIPGALALRGVNFA